MPSSTTPSTLTGTPTTITTTSSPRTPTPTNIHPTAVVSSKATLTGTHLITIGANTIINPFATIDSTHGSVEIGEGVVVWERVVIGTSDDDSDSGVSKRATEDLKADHEPMLTKLGDHVVVEAHNIIPCGVVLEEGVHVGVRAQIGRAARVGAFAKLTPGVQIVPGDEVPPYHVVFFAGSAEFENVEMKQVMRVNRSLVENERMRMLQKRGHEKLLQTLRTLVK